MGFPDTGVVLPAAAGFFASIGEWAAEYGYITIFLVVAGDGMRVWCEREQCVRPSRA